MVIIREDRMLIKVKNQEKGYGSKKLYLNFQTKRLNWYRWCSLCWKLAFSVFVPKDKKISQLRKCSSL